MWTTFFFNKEYQNAIGIIESRPEADQKKQEDAIIELIKENPYISRKEIAAQLGIHDSSVKRRLASLQEQNVIQRIGAAKGGYWQILK